MAIFGYLIQYLFDLLKINTTIIMNNPVSNEWGFEAFVECAAQIVGVLLGGFLTYTMTKRFNERDSQKQKESQRRDNFYTPFCTLIEKVIEESYGKEPGTCISVDSSEIDGEVWKLLFKDAKRYLKAEYRKHLTAKDKEQLEELNALLDQLTSMLNDKSYDVARAIEWDIANAVVSNIDSILKSRFEVSGDADIMMFVRPNTKESILVGTLGAVDIISCILNMSINGAQTEISLDMDDMRIIDLARKPNSEFDGIYDYETKIKLLLFKQIQSINLFETCTEAKKLIESSHEEIIEQEKRILALLNSINERLIREIDRISAA